MFDIVVIGAGVNGSWTALHLAKQGFKTALLDQVSFVVQLLKKIIYCARTYLQPHYGNGVFGNVYLSAGQH
jgi:2-polyprenyl-6-methoxyphenol hydroxylase-like FAD-dependent oxidoreductase